MLLDKISQCAWCFLFLNPDPSQPPVPKVPKSKGPTAVWVLEQINLGAKGSYKDFEHLKEAAKDVTPRGT
jgi:hypothetical protein